MKCTRQILLNLLPGSLLVAALGCAPKSIPETPTSPAVPQVPAPILGPAPLSAGNATTASQEGGVDGGGGGTLPANPESTERIRSFLRNDARRELRFYVLSKQAEYDARVNEGLNPSWLPILFGQGNKLWDVLENTDIELEMKKPCFDANGVEVDGSVHASKPGAICISAYRIAPKLVRGRGEIETLGLILHEFSHLLGATEEEARKFQKEVVSDLENLRERQVQAKTVLDGNNQTIHDAIMALIEAEATVKEAAKIFKKSAAASVAQADPDIPKVRNALKKANETFETQRGRFGSFSSFQTYADQQYLTYLTARLDIAVMWADDRLDQTFGDNSDRLNRVFQGKKELPYGEIKKQLTPWRKEKSMIDQEPIRRPETYADVEELLSSLIRHERLLRNRLLAIALDNPLFPSPGPWSVEPQVNPWTQFIGRYEVVNETCEFNGDSLDQLGADLYQDLKSVEVRTPSPNSRDITIFLAAKSRSGQLTARSSEFDIERRWIDEPSWLFPSPTITITGSPGTVERQSESGHPYAMHWAKGSHQMKQKGKEVELTYDRQIQQWHPFEGLQTGSLHCTYNLKRTN
jgi:hypothetical protein